MDSFTSHTLYFTLFQTSLSRQEQPHPFFCLSSEQSFWVGVGEAGCWESHLSQGHTSALLQRNCRDMMMSQGQKRTDAATRPEPTDSLWHAIHPNILHHKYFAPKYEFKCPPNMHPPGKARYRFCNRKAGDHRTCFNNFFFPRVKSSHFWTFHSLCIWIKQHPEITAGFQNHLYFKTVL